VVIPLHPIIDCGRPSHIAAGTDIDDQQGTAELSHSLLCNLLQSTGVAGSPIEYGGQEDERTWRRGHGFGDHRNYFLHYAHRLCVTSNGVFGAKMMFAQMTSFVADLKRYKAIDAGEMIDTIDVAFGMPRYVQMLRRDKERQAISFVRAAQSGAWNWIEAPRAQPNYDPALLERAGEFLLGQESAWNEAFRGLDQSRRMTLHYEDVAENMEGTVTSLLNWLQIADPARPFRPPSMKRQSDAISQEWLEGGGGTSCSLL
jgi:trehalose 2-sulfotransferase